MVVASSGRAVSVSVNRRARGGRILLLGVDQRQVLETVPELARKAVEIVTCDHPEAALEMASDRRFDLLIVRHPITGLAVDEFLSRFRTGASRSRESYVLVLTEPTSDDSLQELAGRRLRFANHTDVNTLISVVAGEILGVAPRIDQRLMVEIGLQMAGGRLSRFCQVVNLSDSGMLVRLAERPAEGELLEVVWRLPDLPRPIRVSARVVRHTSEAEVKGVGLAFVDLDDSTRGLIGSFVERGLDRPSQM